MHITNILSSVRNLALFLLHWFVSIHFNVRWSNPEWFTKWTAVGWILTFDLTLLIQRKAAHRHRFCQKVTSWTECEIRWLETLPFQCIWSWNPEVQRSYFFSKLLLHCMSINSICIILGVSSTSILIGVENIFSNVLFDLKSLNLELNSDLRTERAVQYFSVLVTFNCDKVGKCVKPFFWSWISHKRSFSEKIWFGHTHCV
jgi:hypothetical protein